MRQRPRQPSRLPLRGTIAFAGTLGALALLFSFRGGPLAPSEAVRAVGDSTLATEELVVSPVPAGDSSSDATAAPTAAPTAAAPTTPMTATGEPYSFRWGTVQVAVTAQGGDITDVQAVQLPDGDRHSAYISQVVEPILREEAISSDSADFGVISGATYTSRAYSASLQSALDQLEAGTPAIDGTAAVTATAPEAAAAEATLPEPAAPAAAEPEAAAASTTATGDPQSFRWGTVQVAVTASGEDIVDVQALQLPDGDRRSSQISQYVEPILREEAITADSSDVGVISGATYTSRAYAASLQSALDQLGI